jgi:hypothetical protein
VMKKQSMRMVHHLKRVSVLEALLDRKSLSSGRS